MSDKKNIFERIAEVKKQVIKLGKDTSVGTGNNSYKALTHDKVTQSIRQPMIEAGISSYVTNIEEKTQIIDYVDRYDKPKKKTVCWVKISMIYMCNDDTDCFITVQSIGHGEDVGDKSAGKAVSYAVKYAHLKTFDIETGENDEIRIEEAPPAPQAPRMSESQFETMTAKARELKYGKKQWGAMNVPTVESNAWSEDDAKNCIAFLDGKIAEANKEVK